jgi:hypothetical protein
MKKMYALCLTVLLGGAFPLSIRAQETVPAGAVSEPCAAGEDEASSSVLVTAVVSKINLHRERATLETSVGQLELAAAPDEL